MYVLLGAHANRKARQFCFLFCWNNFSSFLEEYVLGKYDSRAILALTTIIKFLKPDGDLVKMNNASLDKNSSGLFRAQEKAKLYWKKG